MNNKILGLSFALSLTLMPSANAEEPLLQSSKWQTEITLQQGFLGPLGPKFRVDYLTPWFNQRLGLGAQFGYLLPGFVSRSFGGIDAGLDLIYYLNEKKSGKLSQFVYLQPTTQWVLPQNGGPQLYHIPVNLGYGVNFMFSDFGLSLRAGLDLSTLLQSKYDRTALVDISLGSVWYF